MKCRHDFEEVDRETVIKWKCKKCGKIEYDSEYPNGE